MQKRRPNGPTNAKPAERGALTGARTVWALAGGAALMFATAGVGNAEGLLTPAGPVATQTTTHFWQVIWISMIVVLPVLIGVPLLAWRYRYGNTRARYMPHWEFSHSLEWAMWLVPGAIVAALGVLLWQGTHKLDPYKPIASDNTPLEVQVVGLDWKWLFIYPQYHIATVGQMAFPQDRPVSMKLTTDTVMQSFMIPALAGQIYAMPGMITKLNFAADKVGQFDGDNTQFNGAGFHDQHFTAAAMSRDDFRAWLKQVQTYGVALNQMAYDKLAASSTPAEVHATFGTTAAPPDATFFNDVPSGLFKQVVMRYHDGKPMTPADQPGTAAYNAKFSG